MFECVGCRVRLHAEGGREERRVQLRGGAVGADSGSEAGGGVRGRRGHRGVDQEDHVGVASSSVVRGVGDGGGGPQAHRLPAGQRHPHVQDSHDVRGRERHAEAHHERGRSYAHQL